MAVTPFNFPPLFRKPKYVKIPKILDVRAVVVDSLNNFLLTLQDILNPHLSFIFGRMQVFKQHSRFSRFILLRQDYNVTNTIPFCVSSKIKVLYNSILYHLHTDFCVPQFPKFHCLV